MWASVTQKRTEQNCLSEENQLEPKEKEAKESCNRLFSGEAGNNERETMLPVFARRAAAEKQPGAERKKATHRQEENARAR